ncbi:unnamed protein product, partial [Ectocarpus fasciculatus]
SWELPRPPIFALRPPPAPGRRCSKRIETIKRNATPKKRIRVLCLVSCVLCVFPVLPVFSPLLAALFVTPLLVGQLDYCVLYALWRTKTATRHATSWNRVRKIPQLDQKGCNPHRYPRRYSCVWALEWAPRGYMTLVLSTRNVSTWVLSVLSIAPHAGNTVYQHVLSRSLLPHTLIIFAS